VMITNGMIAPENYRMTGREFKERREKLGLTQIQLAEKLGVNEDSIGKWERGVRPMLNPWMVNLALLYIEMEMIVASDDSIVYSPDKKVVDMTEFARMHP
jgi:transcriptional regulator with XRE-family HTH domain